MTLKKQSIRGLEKIQLNGEPTTKEELAQWKTGDEDIQQEIIDDADWDLVRDKPIDDYGDVEFVED